MRPPRGVDHEWISVRMKQRSFQAPSIHDHMWSPMLQAINRFRPLSIHDQDPLAIKSDHVWRSISNSGVFSLSLSIDDQLRLCTRVRVCEKPESDFLFDDED